MSETLEGKTGVLDVVLPNERQTFSWNGEVEDREKAKAAFERLLNRGSVLASIVTQPGKAEQVRSWTEVENREREVGTVAVVVSPQIRGGAN